MIALIFFKISMLKLFLDSIFFLKNSVILKCDKQYNDSKNDFQKELRIFSAFANYLQNKSKILLIQKLWLKMCKIRKNITKMREKLSHIKPMCKKLTWFKETIAEIWYAKIMQLY